MWPLTHECVTYRAQNMFSMPDNGFCCERKAQMVVILSCVAPYMGIRAWPRQKAWVTKMPIIVAELGQCIPIHFQQYVLSVLCARIKKLTWGLHANGLYLFKENFSFSEPWCVAEALWYTLLFPVWVTFAQKPLENAVPIHCQPSPLGSSCALLSHLQKAMCTDAASHRVTSRMSLATTLLRSHPLSPCQRSSARRTGVHARLRACTCASCWGRHVPVWACLHWCCELKLLAHVHAWLCLNLHAIPHELTLLFCCPYFCHVLLWCHYTGLCLRLLLCSGELQLFMLSAFVTCSPDHPPLPRCSKHVASAQALSINIHVYIYIGLLETVYGNFL